MSGYHEGNREIHNYITAKLRENSLLGYLSRKIERLPSVYRYLVPHSASSGMKPSSLASVKFSRTRHIRRRKEVWNLKVSSRITKKSIRCWPKTTLSTQSICPSIRSPFICVATHNTSPTPSPPSNQSHPILYKLPSNSTNIFYKRSIKPFLMTSKCWPFDSFWRRISIL